VARGASIKPGEPGEVLYRDARGARCRAVPPRQDRWCARPRGPRLRKTITLTAAAVAEVTGLLKLLLDECSAALAKATEAADE